MGQYVGIDVSLESAAICVVDGQGRVVREASVASEPDALIDWIAGHAPTAATVGLEAGPLSQHLYARMDRVGLPVVLLETRHVHAAFRTNPVKTDRNDARGIAQLLRLGWFRPVHCKSLAAQEVRALLTTRRLLQTKRHDVEMSLRGILRGFGLKVGATSARRFEDRVRALVDGHPVLQQIAAALLTARAGLEQQYRQIDTQLRRLARQDHRTRLLMTVPGVGALVALTYVSAIDDPGRFARSRDVGAHFGLTPRRYQSGETDVSGRISKVGDRAVRSMLYEAAHVMLSRAVAGSSLKRWAQRLAKRAGPRKAKVALARRLAVVMHRMLVDGTAFDAAPRPAGA